MTRIYYLDANNNIVNKEEATHFIVQELDENGNLINETFGYTKENFEPEIKVGKPSKKIQDVLDSFVDRHGEHPFRK